MCYLIIKTKSLVLKVHALDLLKAVAVLGWLLHQ